MHGITANLAALVAQGAAMLQRSALEVIPFTFYFQGLEMLKMTVAELML